MGALCCCIQKRAQAAAHTTTSPACDIVSITDGTDTFVIRDDNMVRQTAWFKAHYPVEYMAELLSVDRDDSDKIALVAAACNRMGITLLPPDVGLSDVDFSIEDMSGQDPGESGARDSRGIRFGLAAVKGVGEKAVEQIISAREKTEKFQSLFHFCENVDLRAANKQVLEALIKAGAFDRLGGNTR